MFFLRLQRLQMKYTRVASRFMYNERREGKAFSTLPNGVIDC